MRIIVNVYVLLPLKLVHEQEGDEEEEEGKRRRSVMGESAASPRGPTSHTGLHLESIDGARSTASTGKGRTVAGRG